MLIEQQDKATDLPNEITNHIMDFLY